jgi:glutathione S-transferase
VTVLRILRNDNGALVEKRPTLDRYKKRGEARPGFQKALAAQMATFEKNTPPKS